MPLSTKSTKKANSKDQLATVVETQASTSLKCKANRVNIISSLFGRSKMKNKSGAVSDGHPPSLTCLYANSNPSEPSSSNVSSVNEVVIAAGKVSKEVLLSPRSGNALLKVVADKSTEKLGEKDWKFKKATILNMLKRKSTDQTSDSRNETVLCNESCQPSNSEKCYAGFSECSALCCMSPDIPLITVLKEVLQFGVRLQDSEHHLIQIFTKYLKGDSLEKELIDIVSGHANLQIQIERRSQALASAMWKQQIDLYKTQEKTLAENLKEMVWQNRKLQEENELLMRRMDAMGVQNEAISSERNNSGIVDRLHRSNERLRSKLSNLIQQLHELENNLLNERSRNGTFEEQFAACFSELQSEKANMQAIKMDHQLELIDVRQQLDSKDDVIKGAIQTGDALLQEIERTKQEIPALFQSINWNDQNNIANPLSNIIAMSRFCLGAVVDRILRLQEEIAAAQSERDRFKGEALRFQKTLETTSEEVVALAKQTELLNAAIREKEECAKGMGCVEKERMALENELKGRIRQLEEAQAEKVFMAEGMHRVKDMVHAKDDELRCVRAENETLAFQNRSLSQILMQSGSGDVARELACSQEKLEAIQSHYYQIVAQKEQLEEKLKASSNELDTLKTTNAALTDKVNAQAQTMNELNESRLKMKEDIANQQATLTALQNERRRHLAEKNFLRSIYDRIQSEASKTESLEGSLTEVSQEADRLAIIAEFNKQLGERYQNELEQRDEIITELKESIRSLNSVQQANVKEKAALSEELSEMCSIKEILTSKLQMEVQKSVYITESAKEAETSVSEELKSLKEMQKVERSAVKELLDDFNVLVAQRDNFLKYKGESEKQLECLQQQVSSYREELERKGDDLIEKEQAIVWLDKQLRSSDEKTRRLTDKVECALKKQVMDMERLVNENDKVLDAEKEKYRTSIEYLKSNVHNLQNSLDRCRKSENEHRKLLEAEMGKCRSVSDELKESNAKNLVTTEELAALREHVTQLKKDYDHLFADHQDLVKSSPEHEEVLQRYKDMKSLADECQNETKALKGEVSMQVIKIQTLEVDNRKQLALIEKLTEEDAKVRANLLEVLSEKETLNTKLIRVTNDLEKARNEFADKARLLEEKTKSQHYLEKNYMDAQRHLQDLMETLQRTDEKNVKLKSRFEMVQNMYRTLEETHRKLAEKLLKTVHALMNEKLARRSAESNSEQLSKKIAKTESEKNDFIQKIKNQTDTIRNQEKKFADVEGHNVELEEKLKEAVINYHEILAKYDEVIREFAATEIKCKEYESKVEHYLSACPKCQDMKEKISDLKNNLDNSRDDVEHLQDEITNLKLNVTSLQFEKSENQLYVHSIENQLEVERTLKEESEEMNNKILTKTLELQAETKISQSACDILLSVVRGAD